MIMAQYAFLPLCDIIFNIVSLAAYFCDIVFDVVMGYALFSNEMYIWFAITILFVIFSSLIQQIISIRWYIRVLKTKIINDEKDVEMKPTSIINNFHSMLVLLLHVAQLGVFWRYFKLLIPVDLKYVKYEVRDLCMLRLVHAFCESVPLLIIHLYLYWENYSEKFRNLNMIAVILSLFSVCWALASFNKNVRLHNVHRLVLTWFGVIFQFFWRLGTIGARAISLVAYATLFKYWIFLVILLHWISMFLWILFPKNVFHGERLPCSRKILFCSAIAFVYTFCYINLIEINHREKMLMFYVVMGLENAMLMFVWLVGVSDNPPWYRTTLPITVFLMFFTGLGFMWLYYQFFHVRRLKYEAGGRLNNNNSAATNDNMFINPSLSQGTNIIYGDYANIEKDIIRRHSFSGGYTNLNDLITYSRMKNEGSISGEENKLKQKFRSSNQLASSTIHQMTGIPGVFNCRFSKPYAAAIQKRKRKKPTSFVPPPSIDQSNNTDNINKNTTKINGSISQNNNFGYNSVPFWCRPLPSQHNQQACYNENSCNSFGFRPDIQQKLQEKKMKQLAELKKIEEEIKLGKLHQRPEDTTIAKTSAPPPQDKKTPNNNISEILLTPRYLNDVNDEENQYYDWTAPVDSASSYRLLDDESLEFMYKAYRIPSDLDSQLSLPRSYTLPLEFKYYRRTKSRKPIRAEHFVPSTNSSDGDIDSGDDSDSTSSQTISQPQPAKLIPNTTLRVKHETKL